MIKLKIKHSHILFLFLVQILFFPLISRSHSNFNSETIVLDESLTQELRKKIIYELKISRSDFLRSIIYNNNTVFKKNNSSELIEILNYKAIINQKFNRIYSFLSSYPNSNKLPNDEIKKLIDLTREEVLNPPNKFFYIHRINKLINDTVFSLSPEFIIETFRRKNSSDPLYVLLRAYDPSLEECGPQFYKVNKALPINEMVKSGISSCKNFPNSKISDWELLAIKRKKNKYMIRDLWYNKNTHLIWGYPIYQNLSMYQVLELNKNGDLCQKYNFGEFGLSSLKLRLPLESEVILAQKDPGFSGFINSNNKRLWSIKDAFFRFDTNSYFFGYYDSRYLYIQQVQLPYSVICVADFSL